MWSLRDKYAIAGIGSTRYSSNSGATVGQLAVEACRKAIEDAGLTVGDVDGIVSYNFGDSVTGMLVATALGMKNSGYVVDFASGGNAANLITLPPLQRSSGLAKNVPLPRHERPLRLPPRRPVYECARHLTVHAPFSWITYPQAMAMWCRRHMIWRPRNSWARSRWRLRAERAHAAHAAVDGRLSGRAGGGPLRALRHLPQIRRRLRRPHYSSAGDDLKQMPVYAWAPMAADRTGDDLFDDTLTRPRPLQRLHRRRFVGSAGVGRPTWTSPRSTTTSQRHHAAGRLRLLQGGGSGRGPAPSATAVRCQYTHGGLLSGLIPASTTSAGGRAAARRVGARQVDGRNRADHRRRGDLRQRHGPETVNTMSANPPFRTPRHGPSGAAARESAGRAAAVTPFPPTGVCAACGSRRPSG